MADCIESNCLESNCVEGGDSSTPTNCDLTEVTNLINTQTVLINSLITKVNNLQTSVNALSGGTDYTPRFDELEAKLNDNKNQILTNRTTINENKVLNTAINDKVINIQDNMSVLTTSDIESFVPKITDTSVIAFKNGTIVKMNGITGATFRVLSSRFILNGQTDYTYEIYYDLELVDSNPSRVSTVPGAFVFYDGD